jgi:drug/metabolite transporter (DMT)-like permease
MSDRSEPPPSTVAGGAAGWRPRLDLVLAAALFSTGGAFIKSCALEPLQIAGLRSLIAALFLLLAWPAARRGFSVRSLLFGALYATTMIAFVTANKLTTAANAIYLQSTAPLFVLLLSPIVLHEKVRRADVLFMGGLAIGLALCFGDAVAGDGAQRTAPAPLLGNAIALLSGVAWAATLVGLRWFGKRAGASGGAEDGAAASVVVGNLVCFAGAWLLFAILPPETANAAASAVPFWPSTEFLSSPEAWPSLRSLLFLGVFQVGLAYCVLSRGMKSVPAVEASLLLLVEPVFNPLWAWLAHDEVPGRFTLAGGGVILAATVVHALAQARSAPARADRALVEAPPAASAAAVASSNSPAEVRHE